MPRTPGRKLVVKAGADLHLELINTGTETWTNVSVNDVAVAPLSSGERTWIAWTPATAGHYRLRAHDENTGRFGEALDIEAQ